MHLFKYERKRATSDEAAPTEVTTELGHGRFSNSDRPMSPFLIRTTERRLLLKIDCRLVPCLAILSLICFLDLANLGYAMSYGLREDLHISVKQYSSTLTAFFVMYIVFEIPSNIVMRKMTPRVWLSSCTLAFGLATLCTGFINNYAGLLALRLILGVAQAGIYPGCAYLMGSWYTRQEGQRRFSLYLCTVNLSCVLGGLIADCGGEMNGVGNLAGWRWIFISEGILTCLVAVVFFFLMASFPEQVSWLTVEERLFIKARLKAEQGDSAIGYGIRLRDVWITAKDPKVILAGLIHLSASVPGYMGTYFAPVIVESFGIHSRIDVQLHTAPVWVVAVVLTLLVAYISDKTQRRFWVILGCAIISVAGYYTMFNVHNIHAQYGALFLAISGMASLMPVEVCWNTMNLGGHRRRAIGSAWQIGFGNFGAIIATYALEAKGSPFPFLVCVSGCCTCAIFSGLYAWYCWRQNRKRAAQAWGREYTEEEKAQLGDLSPSYRLMT